jgi:hypothetical protein
MGHDNDLPTFKESLELLNELGAELGELIKLQQVLEHKIAGRLMTRSLFSLLDAFAFYLKTQAIRSDRAKQTEFTEKELRFLNGGEFVVRDGAEVWQPYTPGIKENFKQALRVFAKARSTQTPLGGQAPFPGEFGHALDLRNRVTHPKRLSDLDFSKSDAESLSAVLSWMIALQIWARDQELEFINRVRTQVNEACNAQIEALKKRNA